MTVSVGEMIEVVTHVFNRKFSGYSGALKYILIYLKLDN